MKPHKLNIIDGYEELKNEDKHIEKNQFLISRHRPLQGKVVNSRELFSVELEIRNALPDIEPCKNWKFLNCRLRLLDVINANVYPEKNIAFPLIYSNELVLENSEVWHQEIVFEAMDQPGSAMVYADALVDIYIPEEGVAKSQKLKPVTETIEIMIG